MELSFKYRFEAAHRFTDAGSKCSTTHGHTWWVTLNLSHKAQYIDLSKNFATDFKDLKKDWRSFIDRDLDHHFFLNSQDNLAHHLKEMEPNLNLKLTPGDPTTEVLASLFFKKAQGLLKHLKHIEVLSILLEETPTNSVLVKKEDAEEILQRLYKQEEKQDLKTPTWWL